MSASAAGDEYPTTRVLTADGVVSLIGCLMGNPYINAVHIGHPGWESMGGPRSTRRYRRGPLAVARQRNGYGGIAL